ncbi:MAG: oxidoreductase [Burkholderiales bacterium]|nr:oxidoreductase [Burkholderiales bacterium]
MDILQDEALFAGLKALAESAFPKHCKNCGRIFESAEQFLRETRKIDQKRSGLKQSWDDNDVPIVEVYRNCPCGSTLMDFFSDRRDLSQNGLARREKFGKLMGQLIAHGWQHDTARAELLKVLRGEKSELIEQLRAAQLSKTNNGNQ